MRVAENIFDRAGSDSYASACADLLLEVCGPNGRTDLFHRFRRLLRRGTWYVMVCKVCSAIVLIFLCYPRLVP